MNAKVQYTIAFKLARMFSASRISYNELQQYYVTFGVSPKMSHLAFRSLNARTKQETPTQAFIRALSHMGGE